MNKFKLSIGYFSISSAMLLISQQATAAGFQLNAQSATGLGRAFAGDAIIADNASVISRNAAAMSLFESPEVSFGGIYIDTSVDVPEATYTPISGDSVETSAKDVGGSSIVPNFYYVHPIQGTDWTLGASAYSNFGTDVSFDDDFMAPEFGGDTNLMSVNFGLSAAYRINDQLSLGAGLDIIHGSGEIYRGDGLLDVEADGEALGFNIGLAYEFDDNNRIGLSYRFSPELEANGDVNMGGQTADSINIPLPDMIELSGYHRLQPEFALHYSLQYVRWSEFDSLTSDGLDSSIKEYQWSDAGHISVGGTYYVDPKWQLRAGYMYDIAPTDELTSLSIPDSDRHWISAGVSYLPTENSTIDLGVSYIMGEDGDIDETMEIIEGYPAHMRASTEVSATTIGLQYSYKF
ncbi:outer membrane protein transport protein [Litoribrevibacter albus]|uniref:Long-chain fatty acid transporter n=1 Tax=Litoribrevibacter albus TaxID=1473156 RepID=A0AA37W499_9GAMM|nr:outer membrane protein transport protein [Litoribrevibacter albus]GLQ29530.1 long-chain fatty acid transporter [Litoribrevibacter albus]